MILWLISKAMLPRWRFKKTLHKNPVGFFEEYPASGLSESNFSTISVQNSQSLHGRLIIKELRNAKNSSLHSALGSQDQVRKSNEWDWLMSYILHMWVDMLPKTRMTQIVLGGLNYLNQLNLSPLFMARASHTITDTWWWSIVV